MESFNELAAFTVSFLLKCVAFIGFATFTNIAIFENFGWLWGFKIYRGCDVLDMLFHLLINLTESFSWSSEAIILIKFWIREQEASGWPWNWWDFMGSHSV